MPRKKKVVTVTLGIPVYNEQENIQLLVRRLLAQKRTGWKLDRILIISDGSTDNTIKEIRAVRSQYVELLHYRKRTGQNNRLNELFRKNTSDVIVVLEGDTIILQDDFIDQLVSPFAKKKTPDLVFADSKPLASDQMSLVEQALYHFELSKHRGFKESGLPLYLMNSTRAIRGSVVKSITIPSDVPEDSWIYFHLIRHNLTCVLQENAVIYFKMPGNTTDHIYKSLKYRTSKGSLRQYLPKSLVDQQYALPFNHTCMIALRFILHKPFLALVYLYLSVCAFAVSIVRPRFNPLWNISKSTKKLV